MPRTTKRDIWTFKPRELLSGEHYEAIGIIVTEWSRLEGIVEEAILVIAGIEKNGKTLTTHMGLTQRLDALLSIIHEMEPDTSFEREIKRINKMIRTEVDGHPSLQTERNNIVHSQWEIGENKDEAIWSTVRAYGKLTTRLAKVKPLDIFTIAVRVADTAERVDRWLETFIFHHETTLLKPPVGMSEPESPPPRPRDRPQRTKPSKPRRPQRS